MRSTARKLKTPIRAGLVCVAATAAFVSGVQLPAAASPAPVDQVDAAKVAATPAGRASLGPAGDVVLNGWGDEHGYHLDIGRGSSGYVWRELALLRPAGLDVESWTGYQCLSGDGRYAAVALEPTSVVTIEAARDRGAFAYSVDLRNGKVKPLAAGVGLRYFSPGCGTGDKAIFTLNLGQNDVQTELVTANLATGRVSRTVKVAGQVTSAVPTSHGTIGVVGSTLVSVGSTGRTRKIAATAGNPYDLRPTADGGVSFLRAAPGSGTANAMHERAGSLTTMASGPLTLLGLFQGRSGVPVLTGATATTVAATSNQVKVANSSALSNGARTTSLDGGALIGDPTGKRTTPLLLVTRTHRLMTDRLATSTAEPVEVGSSYVPPGAATATTAPVPVGKLHPHGDAARPGTVDKKPKSSTRKSTPSRGVRSTPSSTTGPKTHSTVGGTPTAPPTPNGKLTHPASHPSPRPATPSATTATPHATTATPHATKKTPITPQIAPPTDSNQTPTCAVSPLDEAKQSLQPSPTQADWASQMDEQGLLTGSTYARPANFDNLGFASYSPSDDFPPIALSHPSGSTTNSVPSSVYEAIMAQESNYDQASFHAPEGTAGDPLISDYYGSDYDIVSIDYASADCGYGIGQVTDGMHVGDTSLSSRGQVKVAVDYQENIAAGLQILETTWNQLYSDGIIANNGDPKDLENWFYAAWAYNSGIQPTGAYDQGCTPGPTCTGTDGTWGMGWANNPANPDYPPNRDPYLKDTYADAAHPADWSYEERVMGWMGSPILKDNSQAYPTPTYHGSNSWLQIPPFTTFCSLSANHCDPTKTNTSQTDAGHCMLNDYECWWHQPATWVSTCATTCATSSYQYSSGSEPVDTNSNPFACNVDHSKVASGAIIVDDEKSPYYNLMGCSNENWTTNGSFTYAFGKNSAGDPIGAIDTHQLGTGLGGHDIFTHTETGANPALINTGTWAPNLPSLQYYKIKIHFPALGANASDVIYTVNPGGGGAATKVRVNQGWDTDTWATLGTFGMQNGGNVVLTNQSSDAGSGNESLIDYDVAFDAIAFIPEGGTPGTPIGGPPTVKDAPKGSDPAWVQCGCGRRTAGDPVDTSTGYFGDSWTDLTTPGRGESLDFSRSYVEASADPSGPDGAAAVNGPFGYGWTDSYNLSASTDATSGNVTITQEDGSQVTFTDSSGVYSPALAREDATLTKSGSTYNYTRRGAEIYTFDTATGHLTAEQDMAGDNASTPYKTSLAYNSSGQLSTITDPAGRAYTLTWASGHITKLVDSAGRTVTYTYDASNDLTGVYGVGTTRSPSLLSNDLFTYAYNTSTHLMTSFRSPKNQGGASNAVTAMTYDSAERVLTQANPDGKTTTFTYGPSSSPSLTAGQTLVTDPAGHKTLDTYANGLLTSQTVGYGSAVAATTTYTYDPASLGISTETDPRGNTTTYTYDDAGNLASSSDPLGYVTNHVYDAHGNLLESIDPDGVATINNYDQAGHVKTSSGTNSGTTVYNDLTSTTTTLANNIVDSRTGNFGTAPSRTTNYYYDDAAHPGDQTRTVDGRGNTTTTTYDAVGDIASITDPLSDKTLELWDTARGWLTHAVSAAGVKAGTTTSCTPPAVGCTTYAHDLFGNTTTTTDPLGHTTKAAFDADGNKISTTDADGNTTSSTFDADDLQTGTARADTTSVGTTYNGDGTVASTKDAAGDVTTYAYDGQGRKTTMTDPDSRTTTYGYDADGNLTTVKNPAGQTTTTTYDVNNRPTGITYSDGTTPNISAITYDPDGNEQSVTDGSGTSSFSYDAFGELTSQTTGAGATVGYAYDADGNTTAITYPDGRVITDTYDNADRLQSVLDGSSHTTTVGYAADSIPTTLTYPNGTTATTSLNNADQPTSLSIKQGTTVLGGLTYGRDAAGQLSSRTPSGSVTGSSTSYTYTALQQVKTSVIGSTTSSYAYDAADNVSSNAGTTQKSDAASQLCWSTTAAVTGSPTCTAAPSGATTYTYDSQGRRTKATPSTGTASTYTYNQAGELTAATTPAGSGHYTYDSTGLRVSRTVGTTTTQFTWTPSGALLTDGTTDYIYGPGGSVIEQMTAGTPTYYVTDDLGSTIALTNSAGAVVGTYSYNTYGKATHGGTATTPLQFGRGYTDAETGLIYLQHRYYDPSTAQFTEVDPKVDQTGQPYTYASDDPLNAVDPTGEMTVGICGTAAATAAIGFGFNAEGSVCLVRTVDSDGTDEIGFTETTGAGLSLGAGASASVGAGVQISSGEHLSDLGGAFSEYGVGGEVGPVGISAQFFLGNNSDGKRIYGGQIGASGGVSTGAAGSATVDLTNTWVQQVHNPIVAYSLKLLFDSLLPPGLNLAGALNDIHNHVCSTV